MGGETPVLRHHINGDLFAIIAVFNGTAIANLTADPFHHLVDFQRSNIDTASNNQFLKAAGNEKNGRPSIVDIKTFVSGTEPTPLKAASLASSRLKYPTHTVPPRMQISPLALSGTNFRPRQKSPFRYVAAELRSREIIILSQ